MDEGIKVITIIDLEGLPKGSVLQDCVEKENDGAKCWYGIHASMFGSYYEKVFQEDCEIWSEEKHDTLYPLKQLLEKQAAEKLEARERKELARLKEKYES